MRIKVGIVLILLTTICLAKIKHIPLDSLIDNSEHIVQILVLESESVETLPNNKVKFIATCLVLKSFSENIDSNTIKIEFIKFDGKPSPIRLNKDKEYLIAINKEGVFYLPTNKYLSIWNLDNSKQSFFIKNKNAPGLTSKSLPTKEFIELIKQIVNSTEGK